MLAYFYCDFKEVSKQNATSLIGSIIWQIANQKLTVPLDVERFFWGTSRDGPPKLSETLRELSGLSNINILIVSRDHLNIKLHFEGLPSLGIRKTDVAKDIELYISDGIERNGKLKRLSSSIKHEIIDALVKGARGMCDYCCPLASAGHSNHL
ncbi:hypothetical protein HOY80DRAFT_393871 [Tuber brumale]|nr:hypothetical protein HOY80DRAFT_393871 [Tuber brumale]